MSILYYISYCLNLYIFILSKHVMFGLTIIAWSSGHQIFIQCIYLVTTFSLGTCLKSKTFTSPHKLSGAGCLLMQRLPAGSVVATTQFILAKWLAMLLIQQSRVKLNGVTLLKIFSSIVDSFHSLQGQHCRDGSTKVIYKGKHFANVLCLYAQIN